MSDSQTKAQRTPGCVSTVVMILLLYQIASVSHGLLNHGIYGAGLAVPHAIPLIFDAMWGVLWLVAAVTLRANWHHAAQFIRWLIAAYVVYHLGYMVLFVQADYDRGRIPLLILLFVLILTLRVIWWLSHRSARTQ